ncbi:MAG: hypothetical protein WC661_10555 [Opitutaceae bacterium]|jgi:hypothetical protein
MNPFIRHSLGALFFVMVSVVRADTPPATTTKPDDAIIKEYRALMDESRSVEAAWKDAPKAEHDEALKAWQETHGARLAELRQKIHPREFGPGLRKPFNHPIPDGTPPAQRAYMQAMRDYWLSGQADRAQGGNMDIATLAKRAEERAHLKKLADAALAERDELEKKLPEEERKKLELRRAEREKERVARSEFFKGLAKLPFQERQAAIKKWTEEHKATPTSSGVIE